MAYMVLPPSRELTAVDRPTARRQRRPWRAKFGDAARGVKLGVRGHSSFFVHFFCTALVVAAGVALECSVVEWGLLFGCIGTVLTAELFNSALETLFHGLDADTKQRLSGVLDIAAGAVLLASVTAAVVGALVLGARLWAAVDH
jgi:diacylglycerol kinase